MSTWTIVALGELGAQFEIGIFSAEMLEEDLFLASDQGSLGLTKRSTARIYSRLALH